MPNFKGDPAMMYVNTVFTNRNSKIPDILDSLVSINSLLNLKDNNGVMAASKPMNLGNRIET